MDVSRITRPTRREADSRHSRKRLRERYRIDVTDGDLLRLGGDLAAGRVHSIVLARRGQRVSVEAVQWDGRTIYVMRRGDVCVTVLAPEHHPFHGQHSCRELLRQHRDRRANQRDQRNRYSERANHYAQKWLRELRERKTKKP